MNTLEQIKHDYEQNHYRKQRELIDAGEIDYWELSEENKKGILQQCKDEGRKYPNLKWMATESSRDNDPAVGSSSDMMFHFTEYYYRRLDPLPTEGESDEVAELKKQIAAKEEVIKLLEYNLEAQGMELENQKEITQNHSEEIKRLHKTAEYDNQELEKQATILKNYRLQEASLYRDIRQLAMYITNQ